MYVKGLLKLVARASLFIVGLLIVYVAKSVYLLYAVVALSSIAILVLRGRSVLVSFLMGFLFLFILGFIINGIYGCGNNYINLLAVYGLVAATVTTITLDEVLLFIGYGKGATLLYTILVIRLSTVLLDKFWRSKEYYTAMKVGRSAYMCSLYDLLGGLPRHVLGISEYMYVHFNREFSSRDR